MSMSAINI